MQFVKEAQEEAWSPLGVQQTWAKAYECVIPQFRLAIANRAQLVPELLSVAGKAARIISEETGCMTSVSHNGLCREMTMLLLTSAGLCCKHP